MRYFAVWKQLKCKLNTTRSSFGLAQRLRMRYICFSFWFCLMLKCEFVEYIHIFFCSPFHFCSLDILPFDICVSKRYENHKASFKTTTIAVEIECKNKTRINNNDTRFMADTNTLVCNKQIITYIHIHRKYDFRMVYESKDDSKNAHRESNMQIDSTSSVSHSYFLSFSFFLPFAQLHTVALFDRPNSRQCMHKWFYREHIKLLVFCQHNYLWTYYVGKLVLFSDDGNEEKSGISSTFLCVFFICLYILFVRLIPLFDFQSVWKFSMAYFPVDRNEWTNRNQRIAWKRDVQKGMSKRNKGNVDNDDGTQSKRTANI